MVTATQSVKVYHDEFSFGDKRRKHGGRAICPNHLQCDDTDCTCRKAHWRSTFCSRDRRDPCPSCRILRPDRVKQDRNYSKKHKMPS